MLVCPEQETPTYLVSKNTGHEKSTTDGDSRERLESRKGTGQKMSKADLSGTLHRS